MEKFQRRWHWVFTGREFKFADKEFPFAILQYVHDDTQELPMHKHEFVELVFVVEGSATHHITVPNVGEYECGISKGDVFIINPEEKHTFSFRENEKLEILNINFHSGFLDGTLIQGKSEVRIMDFVYLQPSLPLHVRFGKILKLNQSEMKNIFNQVDNMVVELRNKHIGYINVIGIYMALILTLLSRKYAQAMERGIIGKHEKQMSMSDIYRVIGFVEHHFTEDLCKEDLARIGMCSVRNLSRKFKECTGETVLEYIHRLRIDKARKMLLETDDKITEIATSVGFNDISFFNKTFKRRMNLTPREYREKSSKEKIPLHYTGIFE